jgi:2-amino-4-hydroxy-6-hydroxymethyldihydropteridine diphosphokinase
LPKMAIIALGSNVEAERHLPLAVAALAELGIVRQVSTAYENPAFGPPGQPDFLNAAVWLDTDEAPALLRQHLHAIEDTLGRQREDDRYAPRKIDLDLCLWDRRVDAGPDHPLPDPDLIKRAYLAATVAELIPDFVHPVTNEAIRAIAERLAPGADLRPRHTVTADMRRAASVATD